VTPRTGQSVSAGPSRAGGVASHWTLDPSIDFLNHGSFGACPEPVLAAQREWRARLERQPVQFFARDIEGLLDTAQAELGAFLGASPDDLAFVPNATAGVNTVLRSLRFEPGDQLLTTNHEYNACANAMRAVAEHRGAEVIVAEVPFPIESEEQVVEAVIGGTTEQTKLAVLDHVTSPTALIFPIERLVRELALRGVDTLVDGAHAPGMLPLEVERIGAAYYTGNCHKWMCAPKGAAFLHVRRDRQEAIRPLSISHGANSPRTDRSRFRLEFDWTGTCDPTSWLCVPEAIRFLGGLLAGGWPALMERNRSTALAARESLCEALGIPAPAPEAMIGSMAAIPLPDGSPEPPTSALYTDPLQDRLLAEERIEVPVIPWPAPPKRLVRVSAQVYNTAEQYERLGEALHRTLAEQ